MTTLSDIDIEKFMENGELVKNGSTNQLGPACYELRMGHVYYDLTESDKPIDASASGSILIKPGHRVVLITQEELVVPINVIARISSKGSLFSIGLSPVSTYADPGFSGNIGIVTHNLSEKFIELPIGESIAKVDFSILSSDSRKPYRGQHGFQTKIWPIKHQLQKTYEDLKKDPRVESEDAESYKIIPRATANALKKLAKKQRRIDWAILSALFLNALVLAAVTGKWVEIYVAILINLISTAVVAVFVWLRDKE